MHQSSTLHLSVTENFLRRLLRSYPHGKVFNFDDTGSLSNSEEENVKSNSKDINLALVKPQGAPEVVHPRKRKKRKMSREEEGRAILEILPGARCVAFFPLWDSGKERWFAGSVVWTTSPTRVLDPDEDMTYLASFGNSIMAEVSRLDALVGSQLKNSFVSSISLVQTSIFPMVRLY